MLVTFLSMLVTSSMLVTPSMLVTIYVGDIWHVGDTQHVDYIWYIGDISWHVADNMHQNTPKCTKIHKNPLNTKKGVKMTLEIAKYNNDQCFRNDGLKVTLS